MTELESAEAFARRIGTDPEMEWSITPLIAAIEADRNAVRVALLNEIAADVGKLAGHLGVARGYEYAQALKLIARRHIATSDQKPKEPKP